MPLEIVDDQSDSAFARAQTGLLFNLPAPPSDQAQLPAGLSLCMIVKNEERFLAACLASVKDAVDEINIVDTGSTDRTVEIARSFGANVAFREWRNDFGWARNESLQMATRRWTLVLDADEEIAPESLALLRALRETPAGSDRRVRADPEPGRRHLGRVDDDPHAPAHLSDHAAHPLPQRDPRERDAGRRRTCSR